jgi:carbon storage regulator
MLVLSRKESQRIKVGDSIVVTVVRVAGDKVRLGIEAPADMLVLREELETRPTPAAARPALNGQPDAILARSASEGG